MDGSSIIIIVFTLLLSAFFAGIEISFLTANKLRIELKTKKGHFSARMFSQFIKEPSLLLTTTLIGSTIALVIYAIFTAQVLEGYLVNAGWIDATDTLLIFTLQTLIGSVILIVLGEFVPKAIFRQVPNKTLQALALPFLVFHYLLFPLRVVVLWIAKVLFKGVFKTGFAKKVPVYSRHDLFNYVSESTSEDEETMAEVDKKIFKNAIDFPNVKVRDCMVPRTDLVMIEVTEPVTALRTKFQETGHSKIMVYRESIDNVIGYVSIVELYDNPTGIDKLVMPVIITTESMPASVMLTQLIEKRKSIALVVDEFGGTSGIITVEDILEQIIGDIEDEHDVDMSVERKISDTEYVFSARLEIDYINEKYELNLPDGDYDTLGGLLFYVHQNIPDQGDVITLPPFTFTVLTTSQARIEEVQVRILPENNS
ncbi:MAG: hemolysin family protein [Bacteroidota bacterium]|nr:hemolysin family protein [Bacteroidota bacterium]